MSSPANFPRIPDQLLVLVAQRLRLFSEPTRMRLIFRLENDGSATVQELADALDLSHQNTSKHLNVLYRAGIVARSHDGSWMRYSLADYTVPQTIRHATTGLEGHFEELADLTTR